MPNQDELVFRIRDWKGVDLNINSRVNDPEKFQHLENLWSREVGQVEQVPGSEIFCKKAVWGDPCIAPLAGEDFISDDVEDQQALDNAAADTVTPGQTSIWHLPQDPIIFSPGQSDWSDWVNTQPSGPTSPPPIASHPVITAAAIKNGSVIAGGLVTPGKVSAALPAYRSTAFNL